MVNTVISFFIASLLGVLAGMGVGGGSLLLLWLTQVAMIEQEQARILNLLFYLPAALISTLLRQRETSLPSGVLWPAILSGCAGAIICTLISKNIDISVLKKLLGGLLLFTGIRELCYRPRNAR